MQSAIIVVPLCDKADLTYLLAFLIVLTVQLFSLPGAPRNSNYQTFDEFWRDHLRASRLSPQRLDILNNT